MDKELDLELQREGRLRLASKLERRHPELAAQFYAQLAQDVFGGEVSRQAQVRLSGLEGKGSFGLRTERLLGQVVEQASDPRILFPMLGATVAYGATRALVQARFAASGLAWGRGWGGRALAEASAFGVEVPTFVLLQRSLYPGSGTLSGDLAHGVLSLGFLKLFSRAAVLPGGSFPGRAALGHGTGILGLFAATRLEQALGLRPTSDPLPALAEALGTYFSFAAGMRAGRALLGEGFRRWETGLAWRARAPSGEGFFPRPVGESVPTAMASVFPVPKAHGSPLMMTGSGGERPKRPVLKTPTRSIPPTMAKELSVEHRTRFMDERLEPPLRWDALEQYRRVHAQLADTKIFQELQKDLLRLVAHPGISSRVLRSRPPTESAAYYGYQHLLRRTAAELYVQGLEQSNFADPMVERGAQILRKVLEQPRIGKAYRPDPRNTEALDYYRTAEASTRQKLFPLYARLLYRLPSGSREAVQGIEMLSRAEWLHQLESNPRPSERFSSAALVGRAYAYLLDATTPAQRAATRNARRHLIHWLPHVEGQARQGSSEALRALVMAARYENPAEMALWTLERSGSEKFREEAAGLRLALQHRELRRSEDLKRRPERGEGERLIDALAYYFREWFWFWH